MKYAKLTLIATLPFLLAATASYAASKSQQASTKMSDVDIYKAREKCFAEAQAAVPGNLTDESGTMTLRTSKYKDCARRSGIRP